MKLVQFLHFFLYFELVFVLLLDYVTVSDGGGRGLDLVLHRNICHNYKAYNCLSWLFQNLIYVNFAGIQAVNLRNLKLDRKYHIEIYFSYMSVKEITTSNATL